MEEICVGTPRSLSTHVACPVSTQAICGPLNATRGARRRCWRRLLPPVREVASALGFAAPLSLFTATRNAASALGSCRNSRAWLIASILLVAFLQILRAACRVRLSSTQYAASCFPKGTVTPLFCNSWIARIAASTYPLKRDMSVDMVPSLSRCFWSKPELRRP